MAGAQSVANFASDDEYGHSNASFTPLNVLWLGIGALVWGAVLFGVYIAVFRPELLRSVSNVG